MLPKNYRLRNEKDIKALFANSKSVFDVGLGMRYKKNQSPQSRFAVVVGTKVSKKAVDRNRIKRRVRGVLEKNIESLKGGYDVVLIARPQALTMDAKELRAVVEKMLIKSGILKGLCE
jgi:ribonuclease P protein component